MARPPLVDSPAAELSSGSRSVARLSGWAAAVPSWGWLVLIVGVSFVARWLFTRQVQGPWVLVDEVIYAELARSFADSGSFEVREVPVSGLSVLYPIVISPAYFVFDEPTRAYAAVKAINALLMSLAALPTYFLARRVASSGLALVAALLAVAVPSLGYAGAVMTENLFYPVVVLAAYAIVVALERPRAILQVAALGAIALAYLARPQGIVLLPAYATAMVVVAASCMSRTSRGERVRAGLRHLGAYRASWLLIGAGIAAAVVAKVARGQDPQDYFGVYRYVFDSGYPLGSAATWFVRHLADLDLYVGIVPFAALLVLVARLFMRSDDPPAFRALAAAGISIVLWMTLAVGAYVSQFADRYEDRLLFAVAPLLFVALVAWIALYEPALRPLEIGCAVAACALPAAVLAGPLDWGDVQNAPGLWGISFLDDLSISITAVVVAGGVILGLLFVLLTPTRRLVLPAILVVYLAASSWVVTDRIVTSAATGVSVGIGGSRDWIDEAIPPETRAASIWSANPEYRYRDWGNEFFSGRLGSSYQFGDVNTDALPKQPVALGPDGVLVDGGGESLHVDFVVADVGYHALRFAGQVVAEDSLGSRVWQTESPLRLVDQADGLYTERFSGPTVTYTRYACQPGTVSVKVTANAALPGEQAVVARVQDEVVAGLSLVAGDTDKRLDVPVTPVDGVCTIVYSVTPTFVPDAVLGNGDTREIGALFGEFEYQPSG